MYKIDFKIYDVTDWPTVHITVHIFSNISRSKGSQTMKFGQLKESKMRDFFLEKSHTKCGGEASHRPL